MKRLFVIFCISVKLQVNGQGVGIGTLTPDPSARLDIQSANQGILIPRLSLVATTNPAPVGAPATSLLVYNTATINDVVPGFYYWDGTKWVSLAGSTVTNAWLTTGNAGTNTSTNFLGTTDAQALTFRTNNTPRFRVANADQVYGLADGSAAAPFYSWETNPNMGLFRAGTNTLAFSTNANERMRIDANGNVGIGTTTPASSTILDISATNKGIRIPNVALTARNNNAPIGAGIVNSLLVYNTATSGTGLNAVSPGFYYWNGTEWVRLDTGDGDWKLDGNTNGVIRYIGTNDNFDFPIYTNGTEKVRVTTAGFVGIGTPTPSDKLHVANGDARIGEINPINTGTFPGYGRRLYFSGGPAGPNFDSENSDYMWIARYNVTTDQSELRLNMSDNDDSGDAFHVMSLAGGRSVLFARSDGNVGIGTATPDASALLDVNATDKGFLAPKVALVAANLPNPITNPAQGLIVYNTATSGTGQDAVFPGYYYNRGTPANPYWIRMDPGGKRMLFYAAATGGLTNYTSSTFATIPGISISFTVPTGMTADVYIYAYVGVIENSPSNLNYAVADIAVHRNGNFLPSGAYNRITLDGTNVTEAKTTSMVTMENLPAGSYTYDLRGRRQSGTHGLNIGGDCGVNVSCGEMIIEVILK